MEYQALNSGLRQIRLLELLSNPTDDKIRCKMHIVSLHDDPAFEALSYTWGEEARDRPISIDDHCRTHVSVNLKTALLRLRRNDGSGRLLWIDALCINQGDIQERNSQVLMMRDIYATAQDVAVWLGEWTPSLATSSDPPRDSSDRAVPVLRAFTSLEQIAQGVHLRDLPLFADPSRPDAEALTVI